MKYLVKGRKVDLKQNDFVAKGGEGSVFRQGEKTFKIYTEPKKMIPVGKIQELSKLKKGNIIRPQEIIFSTKKKPVGFTMKWVNGIPICKMFTNDFRNRQGITEDMVIALVEEMKLTIDFIHKQKCLVVDGNELNYMVNQKFTIPYFIDVDSYQTPSFKATAIMPSIRDYQAKILSPITDWFSFAIIACQLFIGIHPFKGKHPDYKKKDMTKRMIENVSIFNSKVRVPPPTRDFNLIPIHYKEWFYSLFEKGIRMLPPDMPGDVIFSQIQTIIIKSTDNFEIKELRSFIGDILYYSVRYGVHITKTKGTLYINHLQYKISPDVEVLLTESEHVLIKIENERLQVKSYANKDLVVPDLACQEFMIVDNCLYLRNKGSFTEINVLELKNKIIFNTKETWSIMPNSSHMFSGVIYQDVLGIPFICIPIPDPSGMGSFHIYKVPEIEGYKVIDGKYKSGICVLIGYKKGEYHMFILKFGTKMGSYSCRIINDINNPVINFTVLDNGLVVLMNDDTLEIFSYDPSKGDVKTFNDPDVNSTNKLFSEGMRVLFAKGDKLCSLKVKK